VDPLAKMNNLSFGQQKKAMIAFGLATNTALLLMDEPTNGLDIPSKAQFRKLIASALTDDRCIVISTHQVRDLDSLIDTLVVLDNHRILVNKTLEDISGILSFGTYPDTTGMDVIYAEESMKGKNAILQNKDGRYGKTDLELLFNAISSGNKQITDILNKTSK
jgi:ABC-2 type transport system ATP-binding protein